MSNGLPVKINIHILLQEANKMISRLCHVIPLYEERFVVKLCHLIFNFTAKQQVLIFLIN